MKTDRAITICLLHVLREYSDENHILSMQEIRQKMQLLYHIQPDRRTIYSSTALLLDLGYDISTFEDNKIGYYLQSRTFEQSEILLLTDAVYAFSGKPEAITMRCDNIILDDVIDRFGTNIFIRKTSDIEFEFTVHAPPRGIKYWALQYLQYAEVLSPIWLKDQITSSILQNKYITSKTQ